MVSANTKVDVRAEILRVATRLFAQDGYAGTPIQAIADEVGVRKPTLVYHFKSKDALRDEVLGALLSHWRDELPRIMAAASTKGPRLESLLAAMFKFFLDDRHRAKLILRELLDRPEAVEAMLQEHLQPWTSLMTAALRASQVQGVVRNDLDPEAYTLLVVTTAIGIIAIGDRASKLMKPEPSVQSQLDELVRVARAALYVPRSDQEK